MFKLFTFIEFRQNQSTNDSSTFLIVKGNFFRDKMAPLADQLQKGACVKFSDWIRRSCNSLWES
jgi:hypothetical protein